MEQTKWKFALLFRSRLIYKYCSYNNLLHIATACASPDSSVYGHDTSKSYNNDNKHADNNVKQKTWVLSVCDEYSKITLKQ